MKNRLLEPKEITDLLQQIKTSTDKNAELLSISDLIIKSIQHKQNQLASMKSLLKYRKKYETALKSAKLGAWNWNHITEELNFTDVWLEQLGYREGELANSSESWVSNVHPDDLPRALEKLDEGLNGENRYFSEDFRMKHKNGHWVWIHGSGRVMENSPDGTIIKSFGVNRDITQDKEEEEYLRKVANIDPLTKCGNRLFFNKLFDKEVEKVQKHEHINSHFALVDIDFFKRFNDNYGHQIGDKILRLTVDCMLKYLNPKGVLARIGGEEFSIFFSNTSKTEAVVMIRNFQKYLEEFNLQIIDEGLKYENVTLSVGLTKIEKSDNCRTIFQRADKALYTAKNRGRNRLEIASKLKRI